jgi:hypothetical protein
MHTVGHFLPQKMKHEDCPAFSGFPRCVALMIFALTGQEISAISQVLG